MTTRSARMTLVLLLAAGCVRAVPSLPDFHDPLQLHLAAARAPDGATPSRASRTRRNTKERIARG